MRIFIVVLVCVIALTSLQIFNNLLERHAQHSTQTHVKSFEQLGPDITFCFDPDVKDFAACVINLKKSTQ